MKRIIERRAVALLTVAFGLCSAAGQNPPLTIANDSFPGGVVGEEYLQALKFSGGCESDLTAKPQFTVEAGALPSGLAIETPSNAGSALTGKPTAAGTFGFTLKVVDACGASATKAFSVTVRNAAQANSALIVTTSPSLLSGSVGRAYSQSLAATGGSFPYTWSVVDGALPPGLAVSSSGAIAGTPTTVGTFTFTIQVADSAAATATQTFKLSVFAAGTLARSAVLSHLAAGGGWDTAFTLVNNSATTVAARVAFLGEDGTALNLPLNVIQQNVSQSTAGSTLDLVLAPNATVVINTATQSPSTVVGWADVLSSGPLGGFAIFRQTPQTGPSSEGAVPFQAQFPSTLTLPYDNTAGFVMSVAIANLSTTSANITATIWDDSGNRLGTQTIAIAGSGHTSFILPNQLPVTTGKRGIVQFQSPASDGIAGLGLRFSPFATFTSIPMI